MDLQCKLERDIDRYVISKATIVRRSELQSINGEEDVYDELEVHFENSTIYFLPSGLQEFFPHLRYLSIFHCGLREITAIDLVGFENLAKLNIFGNDLKSLPDDLFIHTRKLRGMNFNNNKLEFVSSRLFDPFPENQLEYADFGGNTNIDTHFGFNIHCNLGGLKTLAELKIAIDSLCSAPIRASPCNRFAKHSPIKFGMLRDFKDFSDFTIIIGTKKIPFSKTVLAAQSSVFVSIFKNDVRVRATNIFEIKDATEEGVLKFLRAIYTGKIENKANALELFTLASRFKVEWIKDTCEDDVVEQLNEDNAMDGLKVGNLYKSEMIIEVAFRKIQEMLPDELHLDLKLQPEKVELILKYFKTYKELLK